ncbi:hypothetical protein AB0L88_32850 [Saccharopolyspora shandongensis]|uniref:hypothetical protein n=1 Tax=Saccharopolyspora shandongensis TaxID=418495 RepID=UPI003416751B
MPRGAGARTPPFAADPKTGRSPAIVGGPVAMTTVRNFLPESYSMDLPTTFDLLGYAQGGLNARA